MTTQTTHPAAAFSGPIKEMTAAVAVLANLIARHPELPDAYIVIHAPFHKSPASFDLQLRNASAMEAWREALRINPLTVELHGRGAHSWVEATTTVHGFKVDISGHGVLLTPEQATEPRVKTPGPVVALATSPAAQTSAIGPAVTA
ncbi:hypothetical protein [Streptomyces sp. NPDC088785]|uniref:hypothetical protein n=1 Tax=Streptomyces sp. NPDC088785 TaxID=3365897 RepID=UPI003800A357